MRLALLEIKYILVRLVAKYELAKPKNTEFSFNYFRGFQTTLKSYVAFRERAD